MRIHLGLLLAAVLAGCAGVRPGVPPVAGPADLGTGPGLFSGPGGDFLLIGSDPPEAGRTP